MEDDTGRVGITLQKGDNMLTYSEFLKLIKAAPDYKSSDAYCVAFGAKIEAAYMLPTIWRMACEGLTIKSIASACDTSVRQIALRHGVPRRTVENWASGTTTPPTWQLPLIAYTSLSDQTYGM